MLSHHTPGDERRIQMLHRVGDEPGTIGPLVAAPCVA
jgi:hypothetical protein